MQLKSHPLLDLKAFITEFPVKLGEVSSGHLDQFRVLESNAPMQSSDGIRKAVRDLLRHGGFKPTGRNKPASEYQIKAVNRSWDSIDVRRSH